MGPYSVDLRDRVISAYKDGVGTVEDVAELFHVAKNTVLNWFKLLRETGDVLPRPHGGGVQPIISGETLDVLCALVGERDDATLDELHLALEKECHIQTSRAAVGRALQRVKFTRKRRRSTRTSAAAPTSSPRARRSA